jgi:exo-beta-1,3-glucanase (GH17 family)
VRVWLAAVALNVATAAATPVVTATPVAAATAGETGAVCNKNPHASGTLARLEDAMERGRFIAYQPTGLQVVNGHVSHADVDGIRADLVVLRPRFDSLITYDSMDGAEEIPRIAASLGFRAVIIGVWDPFNSQQLTAALGSAAAYPDIVVGVSLGNELVMGRQRSFDEIATLVTGVRQRSPSIAISTTEPFHLFYDRAASRLLGQLDFLLVNVHPVFQRWFRTAPDANAAEFVVNVVTRLQAGYCGPVLVKETGVPTAPAELGFSTTRQASFFAQLRSRFPPSRMRSFAYFAAFDAPWRAYDELRVPDATQQTPAAHAAEAHWGVFDADRLAKPAAVAIPRLPDRSH